MNAARIDKDAILMPQFVDCRAPAARVSSVEDLQQVAFNDLLDRLFRCVLPCFDLNKREVRAPAAPTT